jgi:hypothetical protein
MVLACIIIAMIIYIQYQVQSRDSKAYLEVHDDTHADWQLCNRRGIDSQQRDPSHRSFSLPSSEETRLGQVFCYLSIAQMDRSQVLTPYIINHSNDILPSQVPFKNDHRKDFCTKINLLDKYTSEETCEESFYF